jgi:hypothetical protein
MSLETLNRVKTDAHLDTSEVRPDPGQHSGVAGCPRLTTFRVDVAPGCVRGKSGNVAKAETRKQWLLPFSILIDVIENGSRPKDLAFKITMKVIVKRHQR